MISTVENIITGKPVLTGKESGRAINPHVEGRICNEVGVVMARCLFGEEPVFVAIKTVEKGNKENIKRIELKLGADTDKYYLRQLRWGSRLQAAKAHVKPVLYAIAGPAFKTYFKGGKNSWALCEEVLDKLRINNGFSIDIEELHELMDELFNEFGTATGKIVWSFFWGLFADLYRQYDVVFRAA